MILIKAIVLGCVAGLFLHFIPCIWWTCDWGPNDGQGVRGGIWFVSWAIIGVAILCIDCRSNNKNKEQLQDEEQQQQLANDGMMEVNNDT